jgi:hypothetical protein
MKVEKSQAPFHVVGGCGDSWRFFRFFLKKRGEFLTEYYF